MSAGDAGDPHAEPELQQTDGSPSPDWQSRNDRYLAASLQWLRLVLSYHSADSGVPLVTNAPMVGSQDVDPRSPPREGWWSRSFGRRPPPPRLELPEASSRPALPETASVTPEEIEAAAEDRRRAADSVPPPALEVLVEQLELSEFERDVLLLCVAMELDPATPSRCARAQGDYALAFPTFALAMRALPDPAWDALSPQHGLRYWHLIEIAQPAGQSLTTSSLRADERIVNYVKGLNEIDARIDTLVSSAAPWGGVHDGLPPSLERTVEEIVRRWRQTAPGSQSPVIQLLGADGRSKLDVAARAAARLDRVLVRLPVELLSAEPEELDTLARLWHREGVLLPIALYIDAQETPDTLDIRALGRFLARSDGAFMLATREPRSGIDRPLASIEVRRPSPAEQRVAWDDAIGPGGPPGAADALAAQFDLAASAIAEIVAATEAEAPLGPDEESHARLWDACVAATRVRLDQLAERIEPRAGWDDIVLPPSETALLHQIADQVAQRTCVYEDWGFAERMTRGLGISVLFAGPSGTGKTMAAEVLARHLRLSLYRIDLSAVMSKYIGETAKNLCQLFDAAESGPALLCFDEADALFGKRSDVKDSHDRYANIEINYLLQRVESYRGLAVLTTNMRGALDQAFLRRLRFIVTFPFPGIEQRRAIWQGVFPAKAPVQDLDFDRLASLPATGAMVQNIALGAAFMAAQAGTPVTMATIMEAARTEFKKLELPVPDAALGQHPAQVGA